jgi:hypothetical protein
MVITGYETIDKELIAELRFPSQDVLSHADQIEQRRRDLNNALALGNLEHAKIKICFEDQESCKVVETTVWGVTDKRVILKQGIGIPICRIHSVKL